MKVIISGGGTGGHIFPAISIADMLKVRYPEVEILFVGAENRMEMRRVPDAGYKIIGLPIVGFSRKSLLQNISVFWKLFNSLLLAYKIINDFQPDIAVGVGGYASGPILQAAVRKGIPILIQEQNSYAGITNRLLAKKAKRICVAYNGMERFFPKAKIVLTGNPVRKDLVITEEKKKEGYVYFGLNPKKKTVLVIGGSLGAKTINESIQSSIKIIEESDFQLIWQSGQPLFSFIHTLPSNVHFTEFISRMDLAYSVADLVVSRAGASSISELCLLGKPTILVPSPNVAENHQVKNAEAVVREGAAIMIVDGEAVEKLIPKVLELIQDEDTLKLLSKNILKMVLPNSANMIVDEIEKIFQHPSVFGNRCENNWANIYFIGAGGIGMSSLIQYFLANGRNISGYDKVESVITKRLNDLGASIHYVDNVKLIPELFKDKKKTLVVVTPAVPYNHSELTYFRNSGFNIIKRAQLLGQIIKTKRGICVAGTHGKTTTSSMIAHLLKQSKIDCNAFLGGILKNYDNNLLLSDVSDLTVVEADEYDHSFYWLSPFMGVITSVDADHLDIYGTEKNYKKAFEHFTSLIRKDGVLLMEEGVDIIPHLQDGVQSYRYCGDISKMEEGNTPDFYAQNVRIDNEKIYFDFVTPNTIIEDIQLSIPIEINIVNSIAALAISWLNNVTAEELKQAMISFVGVKRRFDFHIKTDNLVLIDDYAHHPQELEASVKSVRKLYPNRKLTVIFQPHLYSRTNDFYKGFAQSLSLADEVILLPIYPARENPILNVSSQMILDLLTVSRKQLVNYCELVSFVVKQGIDVVLVVGAGDIELLVEPLKMALIACQ